jgi:multiple sugar transport system permease protein
MERTEEMGSLLGVSGKYDYQKLLISIFAFLLGLTMLMPFIFMLSVTFKSEAMVFVDPLKLIPDKFYFNNYVKIFNHPLYKIWYFNTLLTILLIIVLRFVVVTTSAYAFARLKFRGSRILFLVILSGMLITPDTTIVARYLIYQYLSITDSLWAVVIPSSFQVFFLFMLRQFFIGIPTDLTEAAIIDGCSHFQIYYKIILPLTKPALITMILFTFIWTWNNFIDPFVFISRPERQLISVGLQYFTDQNGSLYALQMTGATFGIILPIILFAFTQKYFVQGVASSGIKG